MAKILYYPYINLPRNEWTIRMLLYYDQVASIVPHDYSEYPKKKYEPFMLNLIEKQLVVTINPIQSLNNPWRVAEIFTEFLTPHAPFLRKNFIKDAPVRIHSGKFDGEIFRQLTELGLAKKRADDEDWYLVEKSTADHLMKYLATVVADKNNMLPVTDDNKLILLDNPILEIKTGKFSETPEQKRKREIILENIIPFPLEIDIDKIRKFKDKYNDLLGAFENKVRTIILEDDSEDSQLFKEKVKELKIRKRELSDKMNENKFKDIFFGTACGLVGASIGLATADKPINVLYGLPGFANAIYSALKIQNAENVFDQSGLKYVALIDRKLR